MKKAIMVEIVWLAAIAVASFLLFKIISNSHGTDDVYQWSMVDNYFLPPYYSVSAFWGFFATIGFLVSFIRALFYSFKSVPANFLLAFMTGLLLYFSGYTFSITHRSPIDNSPYGQDNTAPVKGLFYGGDSSVSQIATTIQHIVKLFLMLVLAFASFMIGRNWNKKVNQGF